MLQKLEKKEIIKIPNNIEIFGCQQKKIIIVKGPLGTKALKINKLLSFTRTKQQLEIINKISSNVSNKEKRKLYRIKRTTGFLIKQMLIETTTILYKKLKLIGVGYRIFPVENFENQLLFLKVGYSHPIYIKIPAKTSITCLKLTQLFIYSHSYQQMTSIAAKIRLNKVPEPYKGKGILYEDEKVFLKEGKKI